MSIHAAAKACADGAETALRLAQQFAQSPPPTSSLGAEIDAAVRRNLESTTNRLQGAALTLAEVAAEATAQIFEQDVTDT
ncbi:hypothetical protein ONA92_26495 [Mycobacteroides salmoniphilum]|uniref:hypothetical protein n=1 Tax=Mycobacteroides salmoniphilum TaxID=404941 RepID=UPI003567CBE3